MSRIKGKARPDHSPVEATVAGIDVSKAHLDVFFHPDGERFRVPNDAAGHHDLLGRCVTGGIGLVVMEATGRYHRAAHAVLHAGGIQVAIINPYRTRRFADVLGRLAKTDEIDASVLAEFAATMKPAPTAPPPEAMAHLSELIVARKQVVEELMALENQKDQSTLPAVTAQIEEQIALCRTHRKALEAELVKVIRADRRIARRYAILTWIPGIGPATAAILLSDMTELGSANAAEIAALAGVAPMNRDSGTLRGRRMIRSGRQSVRNALYMAAVVAVRWNEDIRVFYERLKSAGKPFKIAITAAMRKLLLLANTLLKEDRLWSSSPPAREQAPQIHRA
ncbi:IS110 family transposase [Palleronia caenipelagi]|uniref:IS110 family transposase n=1 Tax=Palleronia caenipelagi TaxID=2489174 RepID=A0A547PN76_9RHOB|nr:IS110 family transposase [Palleronia caenipelagi]TRD15602.1 IS110 family transposase [Palleronia caenipelagi]